MQDPHTQSPERFVWPPRQVEEATQGLPKQLPERAVPATSIREPPGEPAPRVLPESSGSRVRRDEAARNSRLRHMLDVARAMWFHAERTWLDVQSPVLGERIIELGWQPDGPDCYCYRCGQSVAPHEAGGRGGRGGEGCSKCAAKRPAWNRLVRLGPYRPPLTRFVHEVKFTRWRRLGKDLGMLLGDAVAAAIELERARRPELPSEVVVVPVPTTLRRRMIRGIDHSRVIGAGVARRVGGRVLGGVLRREHRASQLAVQPSDRAGNVAGAFHPRRRGGMELGGKLVIVVDDVTTTGATLRGACRAVARAHGLSGGRGRVEVWGAVVAVTELEGLVPK